MTINHSGREDDDYRLITDTEEGRSIELNGPAAYPTCCVELTLDGLSVNTVLQSQHINDYEGGSGSGISFDCTPQVAEITFCHTSILILWFHCVLIYMCNVINQLSPFSHSVIPRFQGITGGANGGGRLHYPLSV